MEGSTTVAVDILIRTTLGSAQNDFTKFFANIERQAKDWVARINKILGGIKYTQPNAGGGSTGRGGGATGSRGDPEMAKALADIARFQKARIEMESKYSQHVRNQTEQRSNAYAKGFQKQAEATKKFYDEQKKTVSNHSFFSSSFWGTLAGNISTKIFSTIAQIPSFVKSQLDEAVKIAQERQNALLGLGSVANARGVDQNAAKDAVLQLRLVKAGIVDIASATTGLKNLLAAGFNLPQAIKLLEAFSDTAAFGKQAALDYGEAIRGATEGIKNGNSILVDNVGLTKNLSIILKEAGFSEQDLMKVQQDLNVRTALYNGLLKEAAINSGDADKLTKTYTGSVASLDMAYDNLYASIGDLIIQSPAMVEANKAIKEQLDDYTKSVKDADSETAKFTKQAAEEYAVLRATAMNQLAIFVKGVQMTGAALITAFGGISTIIGGAIEGSIMGYKYLLDKARSMLIDFYNWASDKAGGVLGHIPTQEVALADYLSQSGKLWEETKNWAAYTAQLGRELNKLGEENKAIETRVRNAGSPSYNPLDSGEYDIVGGPFATRRKSTGVKPPTAPPTGDKGKAPKGLLTESGLEAFTTDRKTAEFRAAMRSLSPALREQITRTAEQYGIPTALAFAQIFSESGFSAAPAHHDGVYGMTQMKPATASAALGRRVTGSQLENPATALEGYGAEMARLFNKYGDWELATVAYHAGDANTDRLVRAAERGDRITATGVKGAGKRTIAYGRQIAALSGLSGDARFEPASRQFNLARRLFSDISLGNMEVGLPISGRPSLDEQHVKGVHDSLGMDERQTALVLRRRNLAAEIAEYTKDYYLRLEEAKTQATIDLDLAHERNVAEEAKLATERSYIDLVNQAKDTERDTAVFVAEQSDAAFVKQRQINEVAAERLNIAKEIAGLQDQLATQGMTDDLRLQRDYLKDILNLREQEYEAVSQIQTAQLEITNQQAYSANRANSQVLRFMASQKGVTEAVADFKIGLIESGYDVIDRGLDAVLPKMGQLSDTVKELLNSFIRLALNAAFRKLFGLDNTATTGGGGARSGGGIGGWIQRLLGGGNRAAGQTTTGISGIGIGGTPNFNPNIGNIFQGGGRTPTTFAGSAITSGDDFDFGIGGIRPSDTFDAQAREISGAYASGQAGVDAARAANRSTMFNQLGLGLAGGMIGSQLGGGSGVGQVLGGVGGGIIGILGSTIGASGGLASGGLFGSTAGLFGLSGAATFGIGLAIGGALLLGSWLFGRAAKRKKEKREVTALAGDVVGKIQQLLVDVQSFKIDGASALNQAKDLRDQYKEEIKKLTTKPAKALAAQKLSQINSLISQLESEAGRADRIRSLAQTTDERLIPTFHSGGMGSFTGGAYGEQGAIVKSNEAVLSTTQIYAMGGYRKLQSVGVNGLASQPLYDRTYSPRATSSGAGIGAGSSPNVYVVGVFDESVADDIMDNVSNLGFAKKVRFAASKNYAGMVDAIEDTMARKR